MMQLEWMECEGYIKRRNILSLLLLISQVKFFKKRSLIISDIFSYWCVLKCIKQKHLNDLKGSISFQDMYKCVLQTRLLMANYTHTECLVNGSGCLIWSLGLVIDSIDIIYLLMNLWVCLFFGLC